MAINPVQIEHKLFSVDEYEQMISAGVLGEDDRLELIEGEIIKMSPIGSLHVFIINRLNDLLGTLLRKRAIVSVQNPIRLTNSQPQPDLTLLLPAAGLRPDRLPSARDVLLLMEVADMTARFDQTVKVPLYGGEGISEYWIIDLSKGVVEVYRGPGAGGYRTKETFAPGDTLAPEAFPDLRLEVQDIVGLPASDD
jgi:Uma2 family endonuclease